ncbi:hypothetical protein F2Q70_00010209 [Brassica cretica]|uniref:Uncharacterized protein n=1 Tax=Brassica cretica TaxID=69181 RepID=A0A8S9LXC0_BRACR|nr:hypothetical protein F2Q70_00010209 [Brassica cretica]KAF3547366.1 hypothetical protein DY000_02004650 [Brassica cretica]
MISSQKMKSIIIIRALRPPLRLVARDSKSSDLSHHEIKIRLTKKQFQDLLSNVNVHDLTTGSDLDRKTEEGNQHRLWRPVLKSIRETRQHLMVTYEDNPSFNTNDELSI